MSDIFEILARAKRERNIEFLLIGGHALQAYGSARQTLDADLLVTDNDERTLEAGLEEAKELQHLCEKYGPADILAEICENLL